MLLLGLVSVAIAMVCDGLWGLAAGTARERLVASPRRLEAIGNSGGIVLVGLGVGLAVTGRKP
jgi:threonine/homoserine/homoserine lactone efflux protein